MQKFKMAVARSMWKGIFIKQLRLQFQDQKRTLFCLVQTQGCSRNLSDLKFGHRHVKIVGPLGLRKIGTLRFKDQNKPPVSQNDSDSSKNKKETTDTEKSKFSNKNLPYFGLAGLLVSGVLVAWLLGEPEKDQETGKVIEDGFSSRFERAAAVCMKMKEEIEEPISNRLLPDPLQEPYYQPPYTLVLEIKDVLLYPEYTYGTGWRFRKRPGLAEFLETVGPPHFEVVIFSAMNGMSAFGMIDQMDPKGYVTYRLFKDATRYKNYRWPKGGVHIKDLSCLNRPLNKVILVDWEKEASQLQPRNSLIIPAYKGDPKDNNLQDLAMLLRSIADSNVEDVRQVLDYYNQFEDPLQEFRIRQRKLQEEQEKLAAAAKQQKPSLARQWTGKLW